MPREQHSSRHGMSRVGLVGLQRRKTASDGQLTGTVLALQAADHEVHDLRRYDENVLRQELVLPAPGLLELGQAISDDRGARGGKALVHRVVGEHPATLVGRRLYRRSSVARASPSAAQPVG